MYVCIVEYKLVSRNVYAGLYRFYACVCMNVCLHVYVELCEYSVCVHVCVRESIDVCLYVSKCASVKLIIFVVYIGVKYM